MWLKPFKAIAFYPGLKHGAMDIYYPKSCVKLEFVISLTPVNFTLKKLWRRHQRVGAIRNIPIRISNTVSLNS